MAGRLLNLGANATSVGTLTQSTGGISGTGNLTISGASNITYGDHRGSGTTTLQGPTSISSSGFRLDGGRTVVNQNTVTWTGGQILFNNTYDGQGSGAGSGIFTNAAGATFIASGDNATSMTVSNFGGADTGADAVFNNAGTFIKNGSQAQSVTQIQVALNNTGTIDVETGTIQLPNDYTNNGTLKGVGTFATNVLTNAGHIAPGSSPGTLAISGNLVQAANGVLDTELATTSLFDVLNVSGTTALNGTLALHCVPGNCQMHNNDQFVILHSTGQLSGTFANTTAGGFAPGFAYQVLYDTAANTVTVKVTNAGSAPQLSVIKTGSGTGTVTSGDGFINCGATCSHTYGVTTEVTLTATANAGSSFVGWLGACHGLTNPCIVSVNGALTARAVFKTGGPITGKVLDIDGNNSFDALTDGLLALRYFFGLQDASLTNGAIGGGATRTTPAQVIGYIEDVAPYLDIDANGALDALSDGLMIIRYLFGLTGAAVTHDAVATDATRTIDTDINNWLGTLVQ
jgi:hypothetical protein